MRTAGLIYCASRQGFMPAQKHSSTLPGLLSRTREVRTLADLKGMRVRVPTELLNVMRDLGADPVTMPMGEVYSSLAKGVLDAVVAPTDTLKSLHFGEVAKYYTELQVPRGAYPARAMGERRWNALNPQDQRLLEASIPIWEAAMAKETRAAVQSGEAEGRAQQVQFIPVNAEEQKRFDELYEEDASRSAAMLSGIGIDGAAVFRDARQIAQGIQQTGTVTCARRADATT
jgi:TRAP-type C4-dicarboxylate transport system substrate-binding protein